MREIIRSILILALYLSPIIAMPLLWRRMKKVRAQAHRQKELLPRQQPWEEPVETSHGVNLARRSSPNEELIGLGDNARHGRWPIDNQ